jgi:hypothetical protein
MDCAIAGEATAVAAAPAAETFKKSRRFIKASPSGRFPARFNTEVGRAKTRRRHDWCLVCGIATIKRKSHRRVR